MPRGLDHIVHAVRDVDAAADFYVRAGFTVSGRNRHPWGTHNRIVQLKNCYIKILEVAEPEKIVPHAARSFLVRRLPSRLPRPPRGPFDVAAQQQRCGFGRADV